MKIDSHELAKLQQKLRPKPRDILTNPEQAAERAVQRADRFTKLLLHRHRIDAGKHRINIDTGEIVERKS